MDTDDFVRRAFQALTKVALLGFVVTSHAQERMPPLSPEQMSAAQRAAVAELEAARGIRVRGPWVALLRSPDLVNRVRALGDYLRFDSVLPPRLSEFLILLTAREWTQQYEWNAHRSIALEAGIRPEVVQAIAQGRRPEQLADDEAVLYAVWSELHDHHNVSDGTYADAVTHFGEQGVVDAVGIIGYYTLLAMTMNTAQTALPNGAVPSLLPLTP